MRRPMFWILTAAAMAVLLGGITYAVLWPGYLAPALAGAIEARTGKPARFTGGAQLLLWPAPAVVLHGLSIGPADDPLLTAESLTVTTTLEALLHRRADIKELALDAPRLSLKIAADGAANFDLGEATGEGLLISAANGTLVYSDARNSQTFEATEVTATGLFGNEGPSLQARGGFVWNRQAATYSGFLKSLSRLAGDGSPVSFGIDAPTGTFSLVGRAAVKRGFNLAGEVAITSPDLRASLKWLGMPHGGTRGLQNFSIDGALDATPDYLAFKQLEIGIDGMAALGDLKITRPTQGAAISGKLYFDAFDTTPYFDARVGNTWSADPIDLAWLDGYSATLALSAKSLIAAPWKTGPIAADLTIADGRMDIATKSFAEADGTATLSTSIWRDGKTMAMEARAGFTGVDASLYAPRVKGKTDVAVNIAATGASVEEWISRLSGTASVKLAGGALAGFDLARLLSAAPIATIAPADGAATADLKVSARFKIADGIMTTEDTVIVAPGVALAAKGDIDLLRRAIDMTLTLQGANAPLALSGPWATPGLAPLPPEGGTGDKTDAETKTP